MSKKIKFSSPEPTGAIISQFYLALDKCFDMNKEECVYIEKDGDVSLINQLGKEEGIQTELKEYSENDNLTDSHLNFWNTLNNWLSTSFNSKKYKYLVLATTQEIGSKSFLQNWNASNTVERKKILTDIHVKAEDRYTESIKKDVQANIPESLKLMRIVLADISRMDNIIDKIFIDSSTLKRNELAEKLRNVKLKFLAEEKRESALNTLLGYIIKNEEYNNGWEINYADFSQELMSLSSLFSSESKLFPYESSLIKMPDKVKKEYTEYNFIKKIKEIEFDSEIPRSLNDYWFTLNTINMEFRTRTQKANSLILFQNELSDDHSRLYNKYSRNCDDNEIINKSKDFFEEIMDRETINFDLFNNTPKIFKNGMYHILADERNEIIWKLKKTDNE